MSWLTIYNIVEWSLRLVMVPVILRRRFQSSTALAWLSVIFLLPVVGVVFYFLIGGQWLGRRRLRLHQRVVEMMSTDQRADYLNDLAVRREMDPALMPVILQAQRISGLPILGGNDVELIGDTNALIDRMVADIDAAEHHVHMLYYIFSPDRKDRRIVDALIRAGRRGVTCRLLADAAGSRRFFGRWQRSAVWSLRGAGVRVHRMLPASLLRRRFYRLDLRNHRKLTVVDGRVAYTGSHNIVADRYGNRWAGRWIDMSGRFVGPVVTQLQTVFLEDWTYETAEEPDDEYIFAPLRPAGTVVAQAVPTGPTRESETLLRVILAAINAARERIVITSPYLVPDEPTIQALAMAVDRGVDVKLVVPKRSDHPLVSAAGRAYFERLLESGVHIYLYGAGMLHAKTLTVDNAFALLGSSNLDIRSFYLNFELNVLLYGPEVTRRLRAVQLSYTAEASAIDLDAWSKRPHLRRFVDSAASLLSPLL